MKTVEQWLAIPDNKLPVELAKVLAPGPWNHERERNSGHRIECVKCNAKCATGTWACSICETHCPLFFDPCPVPDPITIDWNTAMEHMRKCERDKFLFAMWKVSNLYPDRDGRREKMLGYCVFIAQPKYYLIAATLSKDKET